MLNASAIKVVNSDVLSIECHVLVMKFAQKFYGADLAVAKALGLAGSEKPVLDVGKAKSIETGGRLSCKRVFFIGVPHLRDFSYADIRNFSRTALSLLAQEVCEKESVAMTIHGVGYGLDEREAFTAQIAGILEYLQMPDIQWKPKAIVIVERDVPNGQP